MAAPPPVFTILDRSLSRQELSARLFAGELIVYRGLAAMADLVALTRRLSEAAFGVHVEQAPGALGFEELRRRATRLRADFVADPEIRAAFSALFAALGFSPEDTFWDRRVLRMVPPGPPREEPALRSLRPHRDSWGSNIPAQINWWAPVYPLAENRTLLLYPRYWSRPIANTSAGWNLRELHAARARGEAYPRLPVAEQAPEDSAAVPCVIEPGALLCFSAAQLHGSAPNTSARMRVSLETRSVSLADIAAQRGAPNVDGYPGVVASHWFTRIADDAGLETFLQG